MAMRATHTISIDTIVKPSEVTLSYLKKFEWRKFEAPIADIKNQSEASKRTSSDSAAARLISINISVWTAVIHQTSTSDRGDWGIRLYSKESVRSQQCRPHHVFFFAGVRSVRTK